MKKRTGFVVTGAVIILLLGGWMLFRSHESDQSQIADTLRNAVKASKEGRPGGVVEYLSNDVVINGEHYNVNRQFTNFIREYHPDIDLGTLDIQVNGDKATVTTDIKFSLFTRTMEIPNVSFSLEKKETTTWLVFPTEQWRLTGASAPPEAYEQIIQEVTGLGGLGI